MSKSSLIKNANKLLLNDSHNLKYILDMFVCDNDLIMKHSEKDVENLIQQQKNLDLNDEIFERLLKKIK